MSKARTMEPKAAAALLERRDTLGMPLGPGQPRSFVHALGERDFDELIVSCALLIDAFRLFTQPQVRLLSGFFGPVERALSQQGRDVHFVPSDFRGFAPILERRPPRVMATAVAPPGEDGRCSLSLHAGATVAELQRCGRDPARLLIAEFNAGLPRTRGIEPEHPHALSLDEIDVLVPSTHDPVTLSDREPSPAEERIAEHVSAFVEEGATLQTGIGGVPNAVASLLARGERGNFGIHSEMFTNGLMHLHESGKVTNQKGGFHDGYSVSTFAFGSTRLYEWLDGRDDVRFLPVDQVNAPHLIARNPRMVSINGALAVDLYGQLVADALAGAQHSGIGGHEDFVSGPGADGTSLVCLPSTATVGGESVSRIHASLPAGWVVTTPRHQVDVVVTEWGAVRLTGMTVDERAAALAGIAHPDSRDALREEWARAHERA